MPYRAIDTDKAAEAAARQIEDLILIGVLRPRDRLPGERDLAERLGVSRPVLREALERLERDGLILVKPGSGASIADVMGPMFGEPMVGLFRRHPGAQGDFQEFRRHFERLGAMMAAERATPDDLALIDDVIARMEAAHDSNDADLEADLDVELHTTIAEATHNLVLMHVMRSCYRLLADGVFSARQRLYARASARDHLMQQHRAIREAIAARDPARAGAVMDAHLVYVEQTLADLAAEAEREKSAALRRDNRTFLLNRRRTGGKIEETT